jgi:hypothetical protein
VTLRSVDHYPLFGILHIDKGDGGTCVTELLDHPLNSGKPQELADQCPKVRTREAESFCQSNECKARRLSKGLLVIHSPSNLGRSRKADHRCPTGRPPLQPDIIRPLHFFELCACLSLYRIQNPCPWILLLFTPALSPMRTGRYGARCLPACTVTTILLFLKS